MVLVIALVVWAIAAVSAFRYPRVDPLGDTDAYYVLASRGGIDALNHLDEWMPPGKPLLISVTAEGLGIEPYTELCYDSTRDITCVSPDPSTTQGEARNLGRVARERGWQSVTVISQRSHMTRARVLMERCYDGEVRMVPRDVESGVDWADSLIYESGAMVKTWLTPGC